MANYVAFEKKKSKLSKKDGWYIFSIVILSALLIISTYLVYSNTLYKSRIESVGQVTIGEPVKIHINGSGAFAQTVSFYGSMLPNISVTQQCYIQVEEGIQPLVLRAKVVIYENEVAKPKELHATFTNDFKKNEEDGYYYCLNKINENLVLKIMQEIRTPNEQLELYSTELYDFLILIETLPANSDYLGIWKVEEFVKNI